MTARARRLVLTAAAACILGASAEAAGLVHVDWYPGLATYGVSAGITSTRYCSLDMVGWHLEATCETSQ
jgi:hypothetical protein